MENMVNSFTKLAEFYKGKRVFVTGHTGFKGSWLCKILVDIGAEVVGYSLAPNTEPNLFSLCGVQDRITSIISDIRDFDSLKAAMLEAQPEIVIHLAAQPIVRESYKNPRDTYDINVMGTVNILECVRICESVRSFVNVTTDKVYKNNEWCWGYREHEPLDGYDPYSNSKSCSELVTHSYKRSFFSDNKVAISTARAGNVIGGGDFAKDRIIPDCVRAAASENDIVVRNSHSTRPYQHVLEPLFAYLMIAARQYEDGSFSGSYNVGPEESDCITTGHLVDMFCNAWAGAKWINVAEENAPHEANFLKLDCSLLKSVFGWSARWGIHDAVRVTVDWYQAWHRQENIPHIMSKQINTFIKGEDYENLG